MGSKGEITRRELEKSFEEDLLFNSDKIRKPIDVEIEGRTLINLLGRAGNAIHKQPLTTNDSMTYEFLDDSIKVTNTSVDGFCMIDFSPKPSTCYIAVGDVKLGVGISALVSVSTVTSGMNYKGPIHVSNTNAYLTSYIGLKMGAVLSGQSRIALQVIGAIGSNAYFKNIRLYEISQSEFDELDNMTPDRIAEKYPYVDDVKCVVNPYIESKENLLKGANWFNGFTDISGIEETITGNGNNIISNVLDNLSAGEHYTFTVENIEIGVGFIIREFIDGTVNDFFYTENKVTFSPIERAIYRCLIYKIDSTPFADSALQRINIGECRPVLVKGEIPKSYSECHNSRIMFETKLYSGETIKQNNGTYVKNSEWEEFSNFSEFNWLVAGSNAAGTKSIYTNSKILPLFADRIKIGYRGNVYGINGDDGFEFEHLWGNSNNGALSMRLPNALTGWGDAYTPTADEIKAFFLGWYMRDDAGNIYNGTGTKRWSKLWCGIGYKAPTLVFISNTDITICPTILNDQGYTPYRLIYKKVTPTLEKITTHGSLSKSDDSVVTIGSGLVLEEVTNPFLDVVGLYVLNNTIYSTMENRAGQILSMYLDNEHVPIYEQGNHLAANTILAGNAWGKALSLFNLIDYLIYKPDTVQSYDYTLFEPLDVKATLNKSIEENSNVSERLAKTRRELVRARLELSQRSNSNLLNNGDFQASQRGVLFDLTSPGFIYTLDRWYYTANNDIAKIEKTINGVKLTRKTSVGGFIFLAQFFDTEMSSKLKGQSVTLSVKIRSGRCKVFLIHGSATSNGALISKMMEEGINHLTYKIPKNNASPRIGVSLSLLDLVANESVEIEWVKLELGEYATPFVPKSYPEELAMCRFYARKLPSSQRVRSSIYTANTISWLIGFETMRVIPTVPLESLVITNTAGTTLTGFVFSVSGGTNDRISITATKTAHGLTDAVLVLSDVLLDAEIY